ncbi:protein DETOXIFICATION 26-like isoform X1 [Cryptomeria japonica]|uniref:protein DETOXIFICATION 26-like isoform X1 n=1 Tax=Cryptomeria japonica TaxID=3369 RepID=UPI0027DA2C84|nr:protein DETOXIFICATION 26-like isoform X1 [Cryptomeria japonica]
MSVSKKQCFQPLINGDFQPASGALSRFRRLNDKTTGEGGRECHGQGRLICLKLKALRLVSIQIGMGSVLETLCGQAYGAKRYHLLGIHVQREFFIHFCVCIPLAIVWAYISSCIWVGPFNVL